MLLGGYTCLLYSEPAAGSDLAGVRTRAERDGTEFVIKADLVFVAIGFRGAYDTGVISELGDRLALSVDRRGSTNIAANEDDYRTSVNKMWAAGDVRRGQSLVVWAIREGRQAAREIDLSLMGATDLPR